MIYRASYRMALLILSTAIFLSIVTAALAHRDLPDDNLSHPVLIYFDSGENGSGFYLTADDTIYLVTARHVLFKKTLVQLTDKLQPQDFQIPNQFKYRLSYDPEKVSLGFEGVMTRDEMELLSKDASKSKQFKKAILEIYDNSQRLSLKFNTATLLSYSVPEQITDGSADDINELRLQLKEMNKDFIVYHHSADVALIKIGTTKKREKNPNQFDINYSPGIQIKGHGLVALPKEHTKLFNDVLVGNRIYLFGYPTSLTMDNPQLDIRRPLLRGGIIAGKNNILKNIILDSPVYYGNSGGLVLEAEETSVGVTNFRGIGIATQFVPFQPNNDKFQNSGYSVAEPLDFVYELMQKK